MPGVVREGDRCSGHGGFPPQLPKQGSPDIIVNNRKVIRNTDIRIEHSDGDSTHDGIYIGTGTVYGNNLAIQKQGDRISCGSTCQECSGDVSIG